MPDFDGGFKIVARNAGGGLARLGRVTVDELTPVGDTVQTTERLADRAFVARHGQERFVLYLEGYTQWQDSAPWNVLAKSGLLSERHRLPTRTLLFILLPTGYQAQNGEFRLQAQGKATQQLWFEEIGLWQVRPELWWEKVPGLMALYPLCQHGEPLTQAVQHAAQAIKQCELDGIRRADLLTTLGIFGRLKDRTLDWVHLIGREQMMESTFFQDVMADGEVVGVRKSILQALRLRFGEAAAQEFTEPLGRITQLEQLEALLRLAITSRRVSQFRKALAGV